ncbi:MAG: glycosyltransferase family 4 protein [Thaumarchaeota archaeon]|nr:glycosyltransferase family 4 protein [Nitrososphaerota archaeon]
MEWYVHNISRELVKRGHEVEVVTALNYDGKSAQPHEEFDGITVKRVKLSLDWSYRLKLWDGLAETVKEGGYDVIHTYDYAATHSLVALRVAEKERVRSALTVFDVHRMIPRNFYKKWPMKPIETYFAGRTLPASDSILVRAPDLIPPLLEMGADNSRVRVTPSGIRDESMNSYDGRAFREKYSIDGSPLLLFLGRLNPLKGPQHLLEAAVPIIAEFPEAAIVLVGPDQVGYKAKLIEKARVLGISANVHIVGPIYDLKEKMQAYAACDLFVLPTSYEGTSQAIFEAMSQAKPVVSNRVGGIPSQITQGVEGLLVGWGDISALSVALLTLLRDRPLMAQMGANARNKASHYRYSVLAAELEEIYSQIRLR